MLNSTYLSAFWRSVRETARVSERLGDLAGEWWVIGKEFIRCRSASTVDYKVVTSLWSEPHRNYWTQLFVFVTFSSALQHNWLFLFCLSIVNWAQVFRICDVIITSIRKPIVPYWCRHLHWNATLWRYCDWNTFSVIWRRSIDINRHQCYNIITPTSFPCRYRKKTRFTGNAYTPARDTWI